MAESLVAAGEENTDFRFSWGLAIAGGIVAAGVTFFLLLFGAGFGLLLLDPTKPAGPPVFLTGSAVYFFAAQAFGFAMGGYLAGRMLGPQIETRLEEEFRAAAHGLVAWAVTIFASLCMVALAGVAGLGGGLTVKPLYGANVVPGTGALSTAYVVDGLYWPEMARAALPNSATNANTAAGPDAAAGMPANDQARMGSADDARKVASYATLWIALSLLFGGLVSVFAAIVGRIEDDREFWVPWQAFRGRRPI
ncbi:MAG TPA: hypothetical protein VGL35_00165 [Rhizomicrobium sp.]|jgi:hypothetical protein